MRSMWFALGAICALVAGQAAAEPKPAANDAAVEAALTEARIASLERVAVRSFGNAYAAVLLDLTTKALREAEAATPKATAIPQAVAARAASLARSLPTPQEVMRVAPPPWSK